MLPTLLSNYRDDIANGVKSKIGIWYTLHYKTHFLSCVMCQLRNKYIEFSNYTYTIHSFPSNFYHVIKRDSFAKNFRYSWTNCNTISFARIFIARIEPLNDTPCLRNTSFHFYIHSSDIYLVSKNHFVNTKNVCYRNDYTCVMMLYLSSVYDITIFLFHITHHHLKDHKVLS